MFKNKFSLEERKKEAFNIMNKYPKRVPVVCERWVNAAKECPYIDKNKYMVPIDLTLAQFMYVIRKRMKLNPEMTIILLINENVIISPSNQLGNVYEKYKDSDDFLYIKYSFENTFGRRTPTY